MIQSETEYVDKGNNAVTQNAPRLNPVYVEVSLLELMNVIVTRRSSRLADKPIPRYKETRDQKPRTPDDRSEECSPQDVHQPPETRPKAMEGGRTNVKQTTNAPTQPENILLEASSDLGLKFPDCIRNKYEDDKFFLPILANPEEFTNFAVRDGLIYFISEGIETIAVPDIQVSGQSVREILMRQGHSILVHLGDEKTVTYMCD